MSPGDKRKILASVVSGCVGLIMSSHPVTCGGKTAIQTSGGAIGLDLTCVVAKSVMQCLDEKRMDRLHTLGIDCLLNTTYVDDKTLVTSVTPPGLRY